ncbi:MAG: hypothetical protein ABIS68_04465, partial [Casimicrobiaceae bacterium]
MNIFDRVGFGAMGFQFGAGCPGGLDWLDSTAAPFGAYHLDTAIGPFNIEPSIGFATALHSTRGSLFLSNIAGGTFRASTSDAASEARAGLFD